MNLVSQDIVNVHLIRGRDRFSCSKEVTFGQLYLNMSIGTRSRQEDAIYFSEVVSDNIVYLAAADGLGGYEGGAEAARTCVDALHLSIKTQGSQFSVEKLAKFIRLEMRNNSTIMRNPDKPGGACMVIARVDVSAKTVVFYSMGDVQGLIVDMDGKSKHETNTDGKSVKKSVTRTLTPRLPGINFRVSDPMSLEPRDRVFCVTDVINKDLLLGESSDELTQTINEYTEEVESKSHLIKQMNKQVDNSSIVSFEIK